MAGHINSPSELHPPGGIVQGAEEIADKHPAQPGQLPVGLREEHGREAQGSAPDEGKLCNQTNKFEKLYNNKNNNKNIKNKNHLSEQQQINNDRNKNNYNQYKTIVKKISK